jgi:hypothetical protein
MATNPARRVADGFICPRPRFGEATGDPGAYRPTPHTGGFDADLAQHTRRQHQAPVTVSPRVRRDKHAAVPDTD